MIPKELTHDCDMRQYKKFQRDYLSWMVASFLGGQEPENNVFYDMLISRLDGAWQDRVKHLPRSSTKEEIFQEMDRRLLGLYPLHNCHIIFF